MMCLGASGGQPTTNQAPVHLYIYQVFNGRPAVTVWDPDTSSKPDKFEFDLEMSRGWRTNYSVCSKALVRKAEKEGLDARSLATILDRLFMASANTNLAFLPAAATSRTEKGELVWVVGLRWEYMWVIDRGDKSNVDERNALGHVRVFVFSQATLKQLNFLTCR